MTEGYCFSSHPFFERGQFIGVFVVLSFQTLASHHTYRELFCCATWFSVVFLICAKVFLTPSFQKRSAIFQNPDSNFMFRIHNITCDNNYFSKTEERNFVYVFRLSNMEDMLDSSFNFMRPLFVLPQLTHQIHKIINFPQSVFVNYYILSGWDRFSSLAHDFDICSSPSFMKVSLGISRIFSDCVLKSQVVAHWGEPVALPEIVSY